MTDQPDPADHLGALRLIGAIREGVADLERDVADLRAALIRAARDGGVTWREIGEVFGVTPQRAHEMGNPTPAKPKETPQ